MVLADKLLSKGMYQSQSGQLCSPVQLSVPSRQGMGTQEAQVLGESKENILEGKRVEVLQEVSSSILNSDKLITMPS